MSVRPIIDAGPALNFFSINKERLLLSVLGPISAPETVENEVLQKAQTDPRFQAAAVVWKRVTPRYLEVLPDDFTSELAAAVSRISGLPMSERRMQPKNLGETMVIAHAVVAAEAGEAVTVLIDDGPGARLATTELERLSRLRAQGRPFGSIRLASTLTILERAAHTEHVPDKSAMRDVYSRLRTCDDGLVPIEKTRLLSNHLWK